MTAWIALAAASFLVSLEDVPTPPGFVEVGQPAVFAAEEGRIVTAAAQGPGPVEGATAFYRASLPALGWRPEPGEALAFRRDAERLAIDAAPERDGRVSLRYRLVVALDAPEETAP